MSPPSAAFPARLRSQLEELCSGPGVGAACREHQARPGSKLLDAYIERELKQCGYSTGRDVRVTAASKFDIDIIIEDVAWQVAIAIEGGAGSADRPGPS